MCNESLGRHEGIMKSINRRQFAQGIASTAIASSIARTEPVHAAQNTSAKNPPIPLSVMLWTVWTDLPFEQRLANVAKAGYNNVELVGEYAKWSDADYSNAISASKRSASTLMQPPGCITESATPARATDSLQNSNRH